MAITATRVTLNGQVFIVETDAETGELIRRVKAKALEQPLKVRLQEELRDYVYDWFMWRAFVDEAEARGEPAQAVQDGRDLEDNLYQRTRDVYVEWMSA